MCFAGECISDVAREELPVGRGIEQWAIEAEGYVSVAAAFAPTKLGA
jgi:hypothetical protein